ncbi:rhamnogalacturonan acetylesterase [Gramella sp. MAR_2010_147]|uniref:rhamnogalacturonan acetylesterase n=1 Tax=Gramella sp. MAR_2010_147 TaxID=1250205 RepID=UPI000879A20B|nr:rhamnogalacturonan acetylesterase [Gramella sp. MAR_2010_147]SDS64634.1 Lysophospholipase L1 [Gramella sp. MAR_2010_147]
MKNFIFFILIIMSVGVAAQKSPTLFLIGDSTMADKENPETNPQYGWGQLLPELMTTGIQIENHAVNGRSSRSFILEGRWEEVKSKLKPGDFVFIQFGHNDQKIADPKKFTNPYTQYRANLERYVKETRQKNAHAVLLTSIVRRNFNEDGSLIDTHGEYPLVTRMVARDLEVPFVDMQLFTEQLEIAFGPEATKSLHLHIEPGENDYVPKGMEDNTHLSRKGAILVSTLALQELVRLDHELKRYIRPEVLKINPFEKD